MGGPVTKWASQRARSKRVPGAHRPFIARRSTGVARKSSISRSPDKGCRNMTTSISVPSSETTAKEKKGTQFQGLFPALPLPLTNDLEFLPRELIVLVQYMARIRSVGGVVVNGHAGEVTALSPAERESVVRVAREAAPAGFPVIAGIHALNTRDAIERTKEAQGAGADGALVMPPFDFFPGRGGARTEAPIRFFSSIADAVDLPLVVFQYPLFTGVSYSTETLTALADIDSVVAVKNAVWDVAAYTEQYWALKDRLTVFAACDSPDLLAMLLIGADAAIIGISNIAPQLWGLLVSAAIEHRSDEAVEVFTTRLLPLMQRVVGHVEGGEGGGFVSVIKEAILQLGFLSTSSVLPPELEVTEEQRMNIKEGLAMAGLL